MAVSVEGGSDDPAFSLELSRAIVAGKIQNARQNLLRSARDSPACRTPGRIETSS